MFNISKYTIIDSWKLSTGGKTAFAKCGSKEYFLKEYGSPVCPSHSQVESGVLTEKVYQKNKEKFERFLTLRETVNERLHSVACEGGNIINPIEWGVGTERFVEATERVYGLLSKKQIASLSAEQKILLMQTALGALATIHKKKIIHGDIKYSNVAVVKNAMGNYVGKLIDFDCSFLEDNKPSAVGGDLVYMAPEMGYCWMCEMAPRCIEVLDSKVDIFAMGVLFHEYLTGERPPMGEMPEKLAKRDASKVYYWEYVLYDGVVGVSKRIKNVRLANLIVSMLQKEPEKRPTAARALQEMKLVREEYRTKKDAPEIAPEVVPEGKTDKKPHGAPGICAPWEVHKITILPDGLKRMKFVKCERATLAGEKVYALYRENGTRHYYTEAKMVSMGIAKSGAASAAAKKETEKKVSTESTKYTPWDEHKISFVESQIKKMKFVRCEKEEVAGKKVYAFYRENGTKHLYTVEKLIAAGLAVKK